HRRRRLTAPAAVGEELLRLRRRHLLPSALHPAGVARRRGLRPLLRALRRHLSPERCRRCREGPPPPREAPPPRRVGRAVARRRARHRPDPPPREPRAVVRSRRALRPGRARLRRPPQRLLRAAETPGDPRCLDGGGGLRAARGGGGGGGGVGGVATWLPHC